MPGGRILPFQLNFRDLGDYFRNARVEVVLTILGFASGIMLARGLGPGGRGQLTAAMMWPALIGMLISIGLTHAFAYAVGIGWASPERLRRLGLIYTIVVGIPAMALYACLCPFIFHAQFPNEMWIPMTFALSIPLTLLSGLLYPIYQGSGSFRYWNIGRVFQGGAWTVLLIAMMLFHHLTVIKLLLFQLGILALLGVYLFINVPRLRSREGKEGPARMGNIFSYGRAIYISSIAYMVSQRLDQLLLSLWVTPSELGQYAVSVTLSGTLLLIPSAVGPILFSKMAMNSDEPANQEIHQRNVLRLALVFLMPAGLFLTVAGPWLTQVIFGPTFSRAGNILQVLAPATVLLAVSNVLSDMLRGVGKPMYSTYGLLAGMVLTLLGLFWALPRFGIWGAAWVSLGAYATMMAVQFVFWRRWKSRYLLVAPSSAIP